MSTTIAQPRTTYESPCGRIRVVRLAAKDFALYEDGEYVGSFDYSFQAEHAGLVWLAEQAAQVELMAQQAANVAAEADQADEVALCCPCAKHTPHGRKLTLLDDTAVCEACGNARALTARYERTTRLPASSPSRSNIASVPSPHPANPSEHPDAGRQAARLLAAGRAVAREQYRSPDRFRAMIAQLTHAQVAALAAALAAYLGHSLTPGQILLAWNRAPSGALPQRGGGWVHRV